MKNSKPDRCCYENQPSFEIIYDVGTEGERKYLVCSSHISKKPFNMYIKSQKPIDDVIKIQKRDSK